MYFTVNFPVIKQKKNKKKKKKKKKTGENLSAQCGNWVGFGGTFPCYLDVSVAELGSLCANRTNRILFYIGANIIELTPASLPHPHKQRRL